MTADKKSSDDVMVVRALAGEPPAPEGPPPPGALVTEGPEVVLGGADPLAGSIAPTIDSLFGPRGACLMAPEGPLWVADTGHHRLIGWHETPTTDGRAADIILGQPDAETEGRNGGTDEASAGTFNVPVGICAFGDGGLAVADGWNNRVLIWWTRPTRSGVPADIVLGHADFTGQLPNRGRTEAAANTMHWPFGILVHDGRLIVADAGNRRVLIWNRLPEANGTPADVALGQPDLVSRSDNAGGDATSASMRWPHDLAIVGGDLVMSDAGNNRLLIWDGVPDGHNAPARRLVGQVDTTKVDHNQGRYWPDAGCLNMPYGLSAMPGGVLVADTANSRILGWRDDFGPDAFSLTGQGHFGTKGDNRWGPPVRDSLCWPYGIKVTGDVAVVSDSGNHRVCLWRLAPVGEESGAKGGDAR